MSQIYNYNTGLQKLGFLEQKSQWSLKQVQENVVRPVFLCSSWPCSVHMFTSSCTGHDPNEKGYLKVSIEISLGIHTFRFDKPTECFNRAAKETY